MIQQFDKQQQQFSFISIFQQLFIIILNHKSQAMNTIENMQIEQINSAVSFNTTLISHQLDPNPPKQSIYDLGKLLRKKNNHFQTLRDSKVSTNEQRNQASLRAHVPKLDELRQLAEKVRKTTRQQIIVSKTDHQKQQQFKKLNNDLWFDQLTQHNQSEYLLMHNQYQIKKIIAGSLCRNPKAERSMKKQNINRMHKIKQEELSQSRHQPQSQTVANKATNRQKYMNYIRNVILNDWGITNIDQFKDLVDCQFWDIVSAQLRNYHYAVGQKKKHPQVAIILASIRMVEKELKKNLPDDQKSINNKLIRQQIESKRKKDYFYDGKGLLRWGLAYTYYKCGNYAKFLAKISETGRHGTELRRAFEDLEHSIEQLNPQKQTQDKLSVKPDISDPYYHQLLYILRGQMNFTSPNLCHCDTLDFVWLVLRLVQMFKYQKDYLIDQRSLVYQKILESLAQYLKDCEKISPETFNNILYLNAYQVMINVYRQSKTSKKNKMNVSDDDYLHLLLVLYFHPQLTNIATSKNSKQNVDELITEQLCIYLKSHIIKLLNGEQSQLQFTVYYILLIPSKKLAHLFTEIFTDIQTFNVVDEIVIDGVRGWQYIQYKMENNASSAIQYGCFIQAIFQMFDSMFTRQSDPEKQQVIVLKSQNFLRDHKQTYYKFVVKAICDFLSKREDQKQKQQIVDKKYNNNSILNAYFALLREVATQQNDNIQQFFSILQFLKTFCQVQNLSSSLRAKDINKLSNFLDQEKYVSNLQYLLPQSINQYDTNPTKNHPIVFFKQIFMCLRDQHCEILFTNFVRQVVEIQIFILNKKGRFEESKQYQQYILSLLAKIASSARQETRPAMRFDNQAKFKKLVQGLCKKLHADINKDLRIY